MTTPYFCVFQAAKSTPNISLVNLALKSEIRTAFLLLPVVFQGATQCINDDVIIFSPANLSFHEPHYIDPLQLKDSFFLFSLISFPRKG